MTGGELSLMNRGFLPGDTLPERIGLLADPASCFTFELSGLVHRPDGDPRDDLDIASYGIVKALDGRHGTTYPDMTWEPKAAFAALAEIYARD